MVLLDNMSCLVPNVAVNLNLAIFNIFGRSIFNFYVYRIRVYPTYISAAKPSMHSIKDMRPENIQKLEVSIDPTKTEERQRLTNESIQRYEEEFGSLDMEKSYMAMFELLWYSQMPCFDVKGLTSKAKDELSFLKKSSLIVFRRIDIFSQIFSYFIALA